MRMFIGIASVIAMVGGMSAFAAETGSPEQIASFCAEKWSTDYRMQENCREKQEDAAMKVRFAKGALSDESRIYPFCLSKWPYDSRMQHHCIKKQMQSLQDLSALVDAASDDYEKGGIVLECNDKWSGDYRMNLYCVQKQYGALDRLRGN